MNIAIFTNNYLPNPYGVTGSVESFRRELEKRGHSVFIFAPRWPGYIDENPNVFRYPAIDIKFKFRFPLAIPYSKKIDKALEELDLDIIHSQHPNLLGTAARKWARKKNIPLIFTWHTLYDKYAHFATVVPKKVAERYMISRAVKYANQADAVIVPTDSIIPIVRGWGVVNKNITSVMTGVEEDEFSGADRDMIRKKYGIAEDEVVLLLVSRLTSEKNVEFVMRAVSPLLSGVPGILFRLRERGIKTKLLVCGGGDLLPKLQKFAKDEEIDDKIIFTGEVERQERKHYFAAGDMFVYGSKSETQGMIISEAMYMGLPVVAVSATGIVDQVRDGETGFLVAEDSPCGIATTSLPYSGIPQGENKFTEAVEKLIIDENLRKKFGEAGKQIAHESMTSSKCTEKLLKIYWGTIEKK
jgi:1,2-diacylglycerol 3-alpha-glucosyltransferase